MIAGQRVVVVDDSIVRGNTQQAIVTMLREAGAAEVHVRISSPPVAWPCFFGIDFASRAELIAGSLDVEEIRESIGADSLGYVSLAGLIEATTLPAGRLCRACFDGNYPIPVAETEQGKHLLEERGRGRGRAAVSQGLPARPRGDRPGQLCRRRGRHRGGRARGQPDAGGGRADRRAPR